MNAPTEISDRIAGLTGIVGEKYVILRENDAQKFLRDWSGDYIATPACVILPATTKEVSQVVRYCREAGISMVPQGGNTGLVGGTFTVDATASVLVNLSRLDRIEEIDPHNYTARVGAGCIIQNLQDAVAEHDRYFPLTFGAIGSAQIGGALATNAGGLNVLRYGMARDLVLGLEVVLPDGQILNLMSDLRKNNTGPDLKQLFIGTEGTLGIITTASVQLFPALAQTESAFLALPELGAVTQLFALARTECSDLLTAFELIPQACVDLALEHQPTLRAPLDGNHAYYALLKLGSSGPLDLRGVFETFLEKAMEAGLIADGVVAESGQQSQEFWAIREAMVEAQAAAGAHIRTDISVRVSDIPCFISRATQYFEENAPGWLPLAYGHVGDGNVHFNVMPPKAAPQDIVANEGRALVAAIYDIVVEMRGSISAEHGLGRMKRDEYHRRAGTDSTQFAKTLKQAIDPLGILNPGCIFPQETGETERGKTG